MSVVPPNLIVHRSQSNRSPIRVWICLVTIERGRAAARDLRSGKDFGIIESESLSGSVTGFTSEEMTAFFETCIGGPKEGNGRSIVVRKIRRLRQNIRVGSRAAFVHIRHADLASDSLFEEIKRAARSVGFDQVQVWTGEPLSDGAIEALFAPSRYLVDTIPAS